MYRYIFTFNKFVDHFIVSTGIVHAVTKMALAFQSGESVKQALFEELQNILSADKDIRTSAECKIKHLEFTEGMFRYYLCCVPFNTHLRC